MILKSKNPRVESVQPWLGDEHLGVMKVAAKHGSEAGWDAVFYFLAVCCGASALVIGFRLIRQCFVRICSNDNSVGSGNGLNRTDRRYAQLTNEP
jgi:hypothetical protein